MKGSERGASGGEEAAWRDLIANYAAEPEADGGEMPWPERENLPGPRRAGTLPDPGPETDPSLTLDLNDDTDPALDLGMDPGGTSDPRPAAGPIAPAAPGQHDVPGADDPPPSTANGPAVNGPAAHGPASIGRNEDPAPAGPPHGGRPRIVRPASSVPPVPAGDEDFVPPVPPPLPSLDPMAKGAWAALFGGPGYLLLATMAGWAIPGWAAFLAVAAFVGGFATLVIRMGEKPPRDSGPDDGAVI
ncbi:MAG: hypothetical protein ACLP5E_14235 [Streptosporangiaceae bacterium]